MQRVEIVRIPARLSHLGVDELYYEISPTDWQQRAKRLQTRRWQYLRTTIKSHRPEVFNERSLP